jgi:hypothetical protein
VPLSRTPCAARFTTQGDVARQEPPPPPPSARTLYERIGGQPAVQAAVGRFYERVMADPSLAPFFQARRNKPHGGVQNLCRAHAHFAPLPGRISLLLGAQRAA